LKKFARQLILLALVALVIIIFTPGYIKIAKLKKENQELLREIQKLKEDSAKLEKELELLEEDAEYIERVAREKLGLTKEGEIIYKIEGE